MYISMFSYDHKNQDARLAFSSWIMLYCFFVCLNDLIYIFRDGKIIEHILETSFLFEMHLASHVYEFE
jgi:hypothetical protein